MTQVLCLAFLAKWDEEDGVTERNEYYICMREVLLKASSPQRLLGNVEQCEWILRHEGYGFVGEASTSLGKHIFDWSFCGYVILILLSTSGYLCHFIIAQ